MITLKFTKKSKLSLVLVCMLLLTSCNLPFIGKKDKDSGKGSKGTEVAASDSEKGSVDDGDILRPKGVVKPGAKTIIFMKDNKDFDNDYIDDNKDNDDNDSGSKVDSSGNNDNEPEKTQDNGEVSTDAGNMEKDSKVDGVDTSGPKQKPAKNNAGVSEAAGQSGADPQSVLQKAQEEDQGNPLTKKKK